MHIHMPPFLLSPLPLRARNMAPPPAASANGTSSNHASADAAPAGLVKPEKAEFLKGTANNEELRAQRLAAYDEALAGYEAAKKQF